VTELLTRARQSSIVPGPIDLAFVAADS